MPGMILPGMILSEMHQRHLCKLDQQFEQLRSGVGLNNDGRKADASRREHLLKFWDAEAAANKAKEAAAIKAKEAAAIKPKEAAAIKPKEAATTKAVHPMPKPGDRLSIKYFFKKGDEADDDCETKWYDGTVYTKKRKRGSFVVLDCERTEFVPLNLKQSEEGETWAYISN